ncbi:MULTISPECIES: hypothetical protein [unclassified Microbacterium]|uniref:hypothetical protein n=1 Tax=unclassified Microbacterium TaxID=2609290 RepID=UPI003C2CA3EA
MTEQPSLPTCYVRDCAEPATVVWNFPGDGPVRQAAVCDFHEQALNSEAPFAVEGHEIIMGSHLPPELFSFTRHGGNKGNYFELIIGHDRVEESRVRVRVTKELLQRMLDWA